MKEIIKYLKEVPSPCNFSHYVLCEMLGMGIIMTEYIKSIRKMVGHTPILICGASVIVANELGELLLQKRIDNGCWGYHGGCVELDEVVEEAAKRELYEETGLTAASLELFGVFSGSDMHYVYPNGDEVSIIDIVYICRKWSGDLKPDL